MPSNNVISALWEFVLHHGYGLLFLAVMVEQLGAPVPAVPVLLVMGALAGLGHYSLSIALLAAVAATLLSDYIWFYLGRRKGESILGLLCRLSLEPDSCVRRTTGTFDRWGPLTLLFAKFVPGLSTVAPPLAGSARMSTARFLCCDGIGALLWAGSALGAGFLLSHEVERAVEVLSQFGIGLLVLLAAPLAAWIAWKLRHRRRTMRMLRVARISPSGLHALQESGEPVVVVDLRSPSAVARSGRKIPGALNLSEDDLLLRLRDLPQGAHLVFYCT